MFGSLRNRAAGKLSEDFDRAARPAINMLFAELRAEYAKEMDTNTADVLAAQVLDYLQGEDIEQIKERVPKDNRSSVMVIMNKIKNQVVKRADEKMKIDKETRELIVYTLRMKLVLKFGSKGESYLNAAEKIRIDKILEKYGLEFPKEVNPDYYASIATHYYEERSNP